MVLSSLTSAIEDLFDDLGLSFNVAYILLLILYISAISIYTPRTFLAFMNHLYIKIAVLLYIFYVVCVETDIILGMFLLVAFVVTISLDNSIQVARQVTPTESFDDAPIRKKGRRSSDEDSDSEDDEDVIHIQLPKQRKEGFRNSPPAGSKQPSGPRHVTENVNDEEDEEHYQDMMQNQAIRDTFQNLHLAIHELRSMVSDDKVKK